MESPEAPLTAARFRVPRLLRHLACGLALAVTGAISAAGGESMAANTLAVSVTVVASCRISSGGDPFESYTKPAGIVKSSCTDRVSYSVSVMRGAPLAGLDGTSRTGANMDEPAVTVSY